MFRVNYERLKLYILLILMITSVVQVGILWVEQNHEIPTNFLRGFLPGMGTSTAANTDQLRNEYIKPYTIVASSGEPHSKWMVNRKSEEYNELWKNAREYMKSIMVSKQAQIKSEQFSEEQWAILVAKKAFAFNFKVPIRGSMLSWLLDNQQIQLNDPEGVLKIIISPWDDVNYNVNTVYIYDGLRIYTCVVPIPPQSLDKEAYAAIIRKISQQKNLRSYSVIKELDPRNTNRFAIRSDILLAATAPKYNNYKMLNYSLPEGLKSRNSNRITYSDMEEIAAMLLGTEKDNYDSNVSDIPDIIEYKNLNNIYRYSCSNGSLEYKYLPSVDEADKGGVSEAFVKASKFIESIKPAIFGLDTEIYLSGIAENSNSFVFSFDLIVGDVPVYFTDSTNSFVSVVSVRSNSKRIIESRSWLRKFEFTKDTRQYSVMFEDLMNNLFQQNEKLKDNRNFSIRDVNIGYIVNTGSLSGKQNDEPVWLVKLHEGVTGKKEEPYIIPMR